MLKNYYLKQLVDFQLITKTITMTGLKSSYNPFRRGVRPRRYFGELIEIIKSKRATTDTREFDPNWNKGKKAA